MEERLGGQPSDCYAVRSKSLPGCDGEAKQRLPLEASRIWQKRSGLNTTTLLSHWLEIASWKVEADPEDTASQRVSAKPIPQSRAAKSSLGEGSECCKSVSARKSQAEVG